MAKHAPLYLFLIVLPFIPVMAHADICDVFVDECQSLQDDLDELDAQLQSEIEQFEQSLDDEYQQTLSALSVQQGAAVASSLGLEQQYAELQNSEVNLELLKQSYATASAQAKAYLNQRLALLKQEYENRRNALLADLKQDFDRRLSRYSSDFSSALNLHRISQFSYSAQLGGQSKYSESEIQKMGQSMNARVGLYASKEGWAIPLSWQPLRFINLETLMAKSKKTDTTKAKTTALSQARLFYNVIPELYTEVRAGAYIDHEAWPFYGAKFAVTGYEDTWGFDYEQGELDPEFQYEKWQILWLRNVSSDVSMIMQLHRSDYENETLMSKLSSYELAMGYRISTTLFSLLPNELDLDFIFHAPNYSRLTFDHERYTLEGTDWRFALGLSQAF